MDVNKTGKPVCVQCKIDKRDPEKRRAKERRRLLRQYGLTLQSYAALMFMQGGRCAICRTDRPGGKGWAIDHDHTTGAVRGLLCTQCNLGLGQFRDEPEILAAAIGYLAVAC